MNSNDMQVRHPLSQVMPTRPQGPMRAPARALGWFSIGLGLAELMMPRLLARAAGAPNLPMLTRLHGLREIGVGMGLLMSKDPTPWLWGRVAGDVIDVATVTPGLATSGAPQRTLVSLAVLGGISYIDYQTACAAAPKPRSSRTFDYSDRSGFPKPASEMRGVAAGPAPSNTPKSGSTSNASASSNGAEAVDESIALSAASGA